MICDIYAYYILLDFRTENMIFWLIKRLQGCISVVGVEGEIQQRIPVPSREGCLKEIFENIDSMMDYDNSI